MADNIVDILLRARMDVSDVSGGINSIQKQLQGLSLPKGVTTELEKSFSKLTPLLKDYQKQLNKGFSSQRDIKNFNLLQDKISDVFGDIQHSISSINGQEIRLKVDTQAIQELEKKIAESQKKLSSAYENIFKSNQTSATVKNGIKELQNALNASWSTGKLKFPALSNIGKEISKAFNTKDFVGFNNLIDQLRNRITSLGASSKVNLANSLGLKYVENDIQSVDRALLKFLNDLSLNKRSVGTIESTTKELTQMGNELNKVRTDSLERGLRELGNAGVGIDRSRQAIQGIGDTAGRAAREVLTVKDQVSQLRTQANYFFGLQNLGRLIGRGIREAAESVRDLDKAMTETAVVTDFSVTDMWKMLPEYTALANKLGATTQGAYETMTLYFQQGLDKQATFEIGEETMKMARIAGLDYAQTTNMMTAALRGFNMELNQTSAKRVNDVYSELAAITASDTRELGLAMERTASIAHSANMDFGNTTAFLAQMIETTREAPENLGTAMKTIIARFQELKANPYEISEVDGEEVDFNRVDKALKSIGVDLMDNRDKFRDLDEVFMDISSRWDSLSQTQQRYIATMAAGSRQQSRFLAMVQNYDRLKELTTAAANSEGASNVQFNKTLESYEAKVNKLKNAWQAFTMSLANNQAVKLGVDTLQKIITLGNKIIETFGKAGSVFGDVGKGFAEMFAAFGLGAIGFKGLKGGANLGLGLLSKMTGSKAEGSQFFTAGTTRDNSGMVASKITNPIISAIDRVVAAINKEPFKNKDYLNSKFRNDLVKERRAGLYNRITQRERVSRGATNKQGQLVGNGRIKTTSKMKSFTVKDVQSYISDLTTAEQQAIIGKSPIIKDALQKGYANAYKGLNLSEESGKVLKQHWDDVGAQIKEGTKSYSKALTEVYDPYKTAQAIGGPIGVELINAIDKQLVNDPRAKRRGELLGQIADRKGLKGAAKKSYIQGQMLEQRRRMTGKAMGQQMMMNPMVISKSAAAMAKFGGAAGNAGQAMMGLGMAMDAAGFSAFGTIFSTIGSGIMGLGMAAESGTKAVKSLGKALNFIKANPIILVASAVAAAGVALIAYNKKLIKDTRKAGNKVVKNYTKTSEKIKQEITSLSDYQENWATWSSGVDKNGNNVSLGTAEYEDYLKAVKDITTKHPELIKGYNAVGDAIVDNNTVLKEANRLAKEEEKRARKQYLNNGQKIVNSQKTKKRWKASQVENVGTGWSYRVEKSQIEQEAQSAVNAIKKLDGGEDLLKKYGVTLDSLGNITDEGIEALRTKGADLNNALSETFDEAKYESSLIDINDKIATFGDTVKGLEDVSKDYFDWGWTYASEQGYNQIDSNLLAPFKQSIERLAEQGLDAGDFKREIDALGAKYKDLGGYLEDYQDIQDKVNKAQEDFGKDANIDAYKTKVEELTAPMDQWVESLRSTGNQADAILADWVENQKARFNDLSESLPTFEEAFNSLAGKVASANSAYDNWSKRTEGGDYYTAVEGFKKMYDEVNDGIDDLGNKSQSWWSAAESMMGQDYVMEHGSKAVSDHMKQIGRYFEDGKAGVDNFMSDVANKFQNNKLADGTLVSDYIKLTDKGLDFRLEGISDEKYEQLASALGLSVDAFTALINKARQFSNIDFSNTNDMRKAILGSETAMVGKGTTKKGEQNLYMRESEFRSQALATGATPEKIKTAQAKLAKSGVTFTKDVADLTQKSLSKYIKDWGIATGKNGKLNTTSTYDMVAALNRLQYNKDEISSIISNNKDLLTDANEANVGEIYDQIKAAEDPVAGSVIGIQGTTQGILSAVNGIALSMGILTKEGSQEVDKAVQQAESFDTDVSKYKNYNDYEKQRNSLESALTATRDQLEAAKDKAQGDEAKTEIQSKIDEVNATLETLKDAELSESEFKEARLGGDEQQVIKNAAEGDKKQLDLLINEEVKGNLTNFTDLSIAATNAEKIGQNLEASGDKGTEAAFELKKAFIDANSEGLSKLNSKGVERVIDKLHLTDEQLKQIQKEHPEIKIDVDDEEIDETGKKKEDLEDKTAKVTVTADTSKFDKSVAGIKPDGSGIKKAYESFKKNGIPDDVKSETEVEVDPKLKNPEEIKTKIQKKLKDIFDSIKQNHSTVKVKGEVTTAKGKGNSSTTKNITTNKTINTTTKTTGGNALQNLAGALKSIKNKTVKATAKVVGAGKITALNAQLNRLRNREIYVTTHKRTVGNARGGFITENGTLYRAKGGPIFQKKGTDTVPAMLTPGEYVHKRDVVKYFGIDFMRSINHKDLPGALKSLGSAAKGRKGTLGPKGKGGLTLTGEKGFEVAWLPNENRSMILGANGPQMVNLPKNAVVWNHQQSKDILKKKQGIDAGSAANSVNGTYVINTSGSSGGSGGSGGGSKSKKTKKKKKTKVKNINNFSIEEVIRFNIEPKLTDLTSAIEKRSKEIEKALTKISMRYSGILDSANKQIEALKNVKDYNQDLYDSYEKQLKWYRGRQEIVSYSTKGGKSKTKTINVKDYLDANGNVNKDKIDNVIKNDSRALGEAIYKQVSSVANSMVDGMNNAKKAIEDAEQQIADLGKQLSENFYQWKNELTEIYHLTQRINDETSFTSRFASQIELELIKLKTGFGDVDKSIQNARQVLIRNNDTIKKQIEDQQQMIAARQRELNKMLSSNDEQEQLDRFNNKDYIDEATKAATIEWAEGQKKAAEIALKYVTDVFRDIDGSVQYNIDWAGFNADNLEDAYSKDTYEAIKTYLDDLNSAATEFNNSVKDQTDFIKETYEALKEYQDYVVDIEDTLIKGVEEEIENETENAKKISDSIANNLKDLLDEVKRKLDERRKQEDNLKTERDISQKQQRLAALRADTTGGHQVEIAQLEKEIAEAQQDYERNLEDQLLDRLSEQADKAAEQRERQIELAETSNEINAENNKALVNSWLAKPERFKEEIKSAWLEAQGYDEKGVAGQYALLQEFESVYAELITAIEQSGFNSENGTFKASGDNLNTLINLFTKLNSDNIGREDELAKSINAQTDATKRNTESLLTLEKSNAGAKRGKELGADANTLKTLGFTAENLVGNANNPTFSAQELHAAGFGASELKNAGINNIDTLKGVGYNAKELNEAGFGLDDLKNAGFTAKDLRTLFGLEDLHEAGFELTDLKEAGFEPAEVKQLGYTVSQLKNAGYGLTSLKDVYSATEFSLDNMSYSDARAAGYSVADLMNIESYSKDADKEQKLNAYRKAIASAAANKKITGDEIKSIQKKEAKAAGKGIRSVFQDLADTSELTWKQVIKAAKSAGFDKQRLALTFTSDAFKKAYNEVYGKNAYAKNRKKAKSNNKAVYAYEQGGIANFTGPAWLDGTPSKPELVLNAADTKNFLALRDVLSKAINSSNSISNVSNGDTYEININVDHINNDYDVDRIADRVKKNIIRDAGYRNVTQVRNFR